MPSCAESARASDIGNSIDRASTAARSCETLVGRENEPFAVSRPSSNAITRRSCRAYPIVSACSEAFRAQSPSTLLSSHSTPVTSMRSKPDSLAPEL
jgi:hypothetical protein